MGSNPDLIETDQSSSLNKAFAVALVVPIALGLFDFPMLNWGLAALLCLVWAGIQSNPRSWLIIIPLCLPLLYLAPWSGRLLFDEFDFLVLTVLSGLLWSNHYWAGKLNPLSPSQKLGLCLLVGIYMVGLLRGLLPLEGFDTNAQTNYLSNYNSLRVFKGFLWALILLPPLSRAFKSEEAQQSTHYLALGTCLGLIGTGLIVLWERDVFITLSNATSYYAIANALLNFTTDYRATGFFADMHTGGAALDAYLVLALPIAFYAALQSHKAYLKWVGLAACLAGLYALLSTFTRTTYLGALILVLVFIGAQAYGRGIHTQARTKYSWLGMLAPLLIGLLGLLVFSRAGSLALAAFIICCFGGCLYVRLVPILSTRVNIQILRLTALAALAVLAGLSIEQFLTSKWVSNSTIFSVLVGSITSLLGFGLGYFLTVSWLKTTPIKTLAGAWLIMSLMLFVGITAAAGTRMSERFSLIGEDMSIRHEHWSNVVKALPNTTMNWLFGAGLGEFPQQFMSSGLKNSTAGSYAYFTDENSSNLVLGGDEDFDIGQRIKSPTSDRVTISIWARADRPTHLRVEYCRKHLLYQHQYNPKCIKRNLKVLNSEFTQLETSFDASKLHGFSWYEAQPLALMLVNPQRGRPVVIDSVSLKDANDQELLINNGFESGGDRWFAYSDFKHLPWHEKNIGLYLLFGLGLVGLLIHMFFCAGLLGRLIKIIKLAPDSLAPALLAGFSGFFCVALFDSVLDAPRIGFLFYSLLFLSMTLPEKFGPQTTSQ